MPTLVFIWALPLLLIMLVILAIIRSVSAKKHHSLSMDTADNQLVEIPSCSFSSSTPPCWNVFLSFYGKDTRSNFTSHLYSALDQAGIQTFMDEPELEKGEEISEGLLNAIHGSKISIVILSENYAYSKWCLNELVQILSCTKTNGHVVIPVFYYVDPSDVRHHKGSFGKALKDQKKRHPELMVERWKSALTEIGKLKGYHLQKDANKNESNTIQEILENVAPQACRKILHLEENLYGIDSAVEEIYQKLSMESNDIRAIGICGMGGIGKTTTAKAFYNKYSKEFHIGCFIENVRQYSEESSPLLAILNQLLMELLRMKDYKVLDVENGIRKLKQILCSKKALIVLDDMYQSVYLELLARLCNLSLPGSRIIVTTRDANLLYQLNVDISEVDIYMMKELGHSDSLDLFSYHAFRKPTPPENFKELTVSFVTYAGGLPLALKVLGSSLRGRTEMSFWKSKLEKIRKIPKKEIQKILQLSYDELDDETEKAIFLDIAFFFIGKDKDEAIHIFDSCGFFPDAGIPVLIERCLLTIDKNNKFQMHNLIQDMGMELGKSRGLFWRGAPEDMQSLEGASKIEGLILDLTMSTERRIAAKIFEKLSNLRLLEIIGAHEIMGNFEDLFQKVRCIRWHGFSWTYLSPSFCPQNLVSLDMSCSKLQRLWKSPAPMKRLTNLTHLNLAYCCNLNHLPEQLGDMNSLKMIDASYSAIEKLPDSIAYLKELVNLNLSGCMKLRVLPKQFGNMEALRTFDASGSAIRQLPDSFASLINLVDLQLVDCKKLRKLPEQFGNMVGLRTFNASQSAIKQLPDSFGCLSNLVYLHLVYCKNLTSLPNSMWMLKLLRVLKVDACLKLKRLPEQLGLMHCLEELRASDTAIEELPDSIGLLSKLQVLDLNKKLKYVPSSIWNLTSLTGLRLFQNGCIWNLTPHTELEVFQNGIYRIDLPDRVKNMKLEDLSLRCNISLWMPMIQSFSSLKYLYVVGDCQSVSPIRHFSLSKLHRLQHLTLVNCTSLGSCFPELPPSLMLLNISGHTALQQLPDMSNLNKLLILNIRRCINLQSLPPLPPHLKLIKVTKCKSLKDLPDLSLLKELESLIFSGCSNLKVINLQETSLTVEQNSSFLFKATLPNSKIAEWLSSKSNGDVVTDHMLLFAVWNYYISCRTGDFSEYHVWKTFQSWSDCLNFQVL